VVGAATAAAVVEAASAASVLETAPSTVVTVPAAAEAAAAATVPAAAAFSSLLVLVWMGGGRRRSGNESARDLALKEDAELLFQGSTGQEMLFSLPGSGVDAENVVDELDQFLDPKRIILQFRQAEVGSIQKSVYGFK
jgi:hypothetical protein